MNKLIVLITFFLLLVGCSISHAKSSLAPVTARKGLKSTSVRNNYSSPNKSIHDAAYDENIVDIDDEINLSITGSTVSSTTTTSSIDYRGLSNIFGGALAHLTLGTLYCWGNFISYSPQELKFFDGKLHPGNQPDSLYVIPLTLVFQALSMPFGPSIVKKIGARKTMLMGCWLTAIATFLASYQKNLASFMFFYSAMFGTGVGLAYIAPMIAGWSYLPNARGLVSGGVLAGFGAGGFFFSLIGSKIVNPKGLNAINGVFTPEIYNNFPKMLRTLGILYAIVSFVGSLFLFEPKSTINEPIKSLSPSHSKPSTIKDKNVVISKPSRSSIPSSSSSLSSSTTTTTATLPGVTVLEAVKSQQFWLMWFMIVASATTGLNTAAIYKQYAATSSALTGDQYQAFVGGIGAIFNGSGRLFWGSLSDKIGFKLSFVLLTLLQMTSMLTYMASAYSKTLFAINTCSLFFCLAGNLALMPPVVQKIFGPRAGATIYGILYSSFAVASIVGGILTKNLAKSIGWKGLFSVLAGMSFLATLLVQLLKPVSSYASSTI